MSSQKQCHRMRRFEKELSKRYRDVFDRVDYLERRPPIWRLMSYIKWKKEGTKKWPK